MKLCKTKEIRQALITEEEIKKVFENGGCISYIEHKNNPVVLGPGMLLKVNTNIGISTPKGLNAEIVKLCRIASVPYAPDMMMDHTAIELPKPFWKIMTEEFDGPLGTIPVYSVFREGKGIDPGELLFTIENMAVNGINFMGFHHTSTIEINEIARKYRTIPSTSWGGTLVLRDAYMNRREGNVILENLDKILEILKKHNVTMNIGTTFRPARISEALDEAQMAEIAMQKKIIDYARKAGVNVILEGVGHLALNDISRYCNLTREHNTPMMPLGPIVTDASVGCDHVSNAIGATIMALNGNMGVVNSVTSMEHLGGVPSTEVVLEGLKTAQVVAHSINLTRFEKIRRIDNMISDNRAKGKTCVIQDGLFTEKQSLKTALEKGCSRCNDQCPLVFTEKGNQDHG